MTTRNRAGGVDPSAAGSRAGERGPTPEDERLNDSILALLREAAEQREARTLAQTTEDRAAARLQFDAIVALSRQRHSTVRR
jgi:hypothetical protein